MKPYCFRCSCSYVHPGNTPLPALARARQARSGLSAGSMLIATSVCPRGLRASPDDVHNIVPPRFRCCFSRPQRWSKLAGCAFLSFALVIVSVLAAITLYFFYHERVEESWKVAGIGVYTGGSINLMRSDRAQGEGARARSDQHRGYAGVHTVFLFILSYAQRVLTKILPPFCYPTVAMGDTRGVGAIPYYEGA